MTPDQDLWRVPEMVPRPAGDALGRLSPGPAQRSIAAELICIMEACPAIRDA
jgi:hypothetical protein